MMYKIFQSVGKGCYVINLSRISKEDGVSYDKPVSQEKETEDVAVQEDTKVYNDYAILSSTDYQPDVTQTTNEDKTTIETILDIIKRNSDNLQYEDGFGTYEIKTSLARQGVVNVSAYIPSYFKNNELTSRNSAKEIKNILERLANRYTSDDCYDYIMASNMLSSASILID